MVGVGSEVTANHFPGEIKTNVAKIVLEQRFESRTSHNLPTGHVKLFYFSFMLC